MRQRAGARRRGGFETWIKMNAADEVIAENALVWDSLDDATKGEMINRRAAELQRDYDARVREESR